MNSLILTCYPLPAATASRLVPEYGPKVEMLSLSSLRVMPVRDLWALLREKRPNKVVAVMGDPSEKVVLPVLLTLGSLVSARGLFVRDMQTGEELKVARVRAMFGFTAILVATIDGHFRKRVAGNRARRLLRARPRAHKALAGRKGLYLKTNLMIGTHAGGSVGHVAGIVNELVRRDPGTVVQSLEFPATVRDDARFEGIAGLRNYGTPPESNQLRFNKAAIAQGLQALQRERFSFIYQRMSLANYTGVELSRAFDVPLILEYNGSEVWVSRHWGLPLKWESLCQDIEDCCLRHAALIVTVSEPLRDELIARKVPAERIVTYPNCIDPEMFDPAKLAAQGANIRAELGIGDEEYLGIFVGTFGRWHGADVLAEAIDLWRGEHDKGRKRVRFLFVGDGLLAPEIRGRLSEATAAGDAIFTGLVPQALTPAYLAAADFCLSPHLPPLDGSRFFGSPTKLFEYMAMAKPIVASRLEQLEDVLGPQDDDPRDVALLVEPGNAAAICSAVEELIRQPDRARAFGHAARERALRRYTWARHVDEIFDAFYEVSGT